MLVVYSLVEQSEGYSGIHNLKVKIWFENRNLKVLKDKEFEQKTTF